MVLGARRRVCKEVRYAVWLLFTYLVVADLGEEGGGKDLCLFIVETLDTDIRVGISSGSFLLRWSHW
jgi:hypothetical protein